MCDRRSAREGFGVARHRSPDTHTAACGGRGGRRQLPWRRSEASLARPLLGAVSVAFLQLHGGPLTYHGSLTTRHQNIKCSKPVACCWGMCGGDTQVVLKLLTWFSHRGVARQTTSRWSASRATASSPLTQSNYVLGVFIGSPFDASTCVGGGVRGAHAHPNHPPMEEVGAALLNDEDEHAWLRQVGGAGRWTAEGASCSALGSARLWGPSQLRGDTCLRQPRALSHTAQRIWTICMLGRPRLKLGRHTGLKRARRIGGSST